MAKLIDMPLGHEPVWVTEHEYLLRWKGRCVRVDVRKLKPLPPMSPTLLRDSAVSAAEFVDRILRGA